MVTEAKKLDRGTEPNYDTFLIAHFVSKPRRLDLVSLALRIGRAEEERMARQGRPRRGPKGSPITWLARRLGVVTSTVKTWMHGEEPSDYNTERLIRLIAQYNGSHAKRLQDLITADMQQYIEAVANFVSRLEFSEENQQDRGTEPNYESVDAGATGAHTITHPKKLEGLATAPHGISPPSVARPAKPASQRTKMEVSRS